LVVGPNGAGKTTLLRVLAGLAPPSSGWARWRRFDVTRIPPERRHEVVYQGHSDGLKKHLTAEENLWFYRTLWDCDTPLAPLVQELELEQVMRLPLRHLSAGQRRRVSLCTLKLRAAKLWILDEPMTNLDKKGRRVAIRWIREHLGAGGLAAVATHSPGDLMQPGTLLIEL
jgi:heme exporter protein A